MSVGDKYEEGKLALERSSMTLAEWVKEVREEVAPEWLASQIADPQGLIEKAAKNFGNGAYLVGVPIQNALLDVIEEEAKRRMEQARRDYQDEYGHEQR